MRRTVSLYPHHSFPKAVQLSARKVHLDLLISLMGKLIAKRVSAQLSQTSKVESCLEGTSVLPYSEEMTYVAERL